MSRLVSTAVQVFLTWRTYTAILATSSTEYPSHTKPSPPWPTVKTTVLAPSKRQEITPRIVIEMPCNIQQGKNCLLCHTPLCVCIVSTASRLAVYVVQWNSRDISRWYSSWRLVHELGIELNPIHFKSVERTPLSKLYGLTELGREKNNNNMFVTSRLCCRS